ncbi:respiratory chain complex I subunit 1 family protein [Lachnoclostridium sp. Marseille-P6806]|uniref:respiratory chain complex I subunit 1 family protein n=1 Tax=Lachnoclostridium sp. Marseille-P6806 TaxID=2364793 RepID=UPI001031C531|nr:complex I subunit 1 family protein [Lachnoclostridium sp. Marseille-P6806]
MDFLMLAVQILVFPGLLFMTAMGVLLTGLGGKLVARLQNRVGPPVLQPWYDILKCFGKEMIVPEHAGRAVYIGAPVLGFAVLCTAGFFIPMGGRAVFSGTADVIVVLYLLTFCSVMAMAGAASTGSPFAGVGVSREMVAMISYELPFVLILLAVGKLAGSDTGGVTFSLQSIAEWQRIHGPVLFHWSMIPAAIAMLFVISCEAGLHPFDVAEAETEICEGLLAEYSGLPLAFYRLTHCVRLFIMTALFAALFLGGLAAGNDGLAVLLLVAVCIVLTFLCMALPHGICARLRVEQLFRFYWTVVTGLALVSLVLVWFGL